MKNGFHLSFLCITAQLRLATSKTVKKLPPVVYVCLSSFGGDVDDDADMATVALQAYLEQVMSPQHPSHPGNLV